MSTSLCIAPLAPTTCWEPPPSPAPGRARWGVCHGDEPGRLHLHHRHLRLSVLCVCRRVADVQRVHHQRRGAPTPRHTPGPGSPPGFYGNPRKLREEGAGYSPHPKWARGGGVRPPPCCQILGGPSFGPQKHFYTAHRANKTKKDLVWLVFFLWKQLQIGLAAIKGFF